MKVKFAILFFLLFTLESSPSPAVEQRETLPGAETTSLPSEKKEPPGPQAQIIALKECREIAISRHRPTRIARERLKVAEAKLREAQRAFFPTLSAKLEDGTGKLAEGKFDRRSYGLESEIYLSKGGQTAATYNQAKIGLEITRKEYQRVKQEFDFEVAKAYYRLVKARQSERIKEELQKEARPVFELAQAGHKEGAISLIDSRACSARCEQIELQRAQAKNESALAELSLRHLLNMGPGEELGVDCELSPKGVDLTLEDSLTLAFKDRPEVSIEKYGVDYAKQGKKIAKAKDLPWLVVVGTAGRAAEVWKHEETNLKNEWSLMGKVSWSFGGNSAGYSYETQKQAPALSTVRSLEYSGHRVEFSFLDNLKCFSDRAEAEVEYQKALDELESIFERIAYEVGESYYGLKSALLKAEAAKNQMDYRKSNLEISQAMKEMGKISLPDLLEGLEESAKAESEYVEALAESNVAYAKLECAIGADTE